MAKNNKNHLTIFVCSHIPFRFPKRFERKSLYTVITNSFDKFPPMDVDILKVNLMKCDYGPEQNKCLNEWRMINAIYRMKKLPDYIGICHYRRYYKGVELFDMDTLNECGYRIVLGNPVVYKYSPLRQEMSTKDYYAYWHNVDDFNTLERVFKEMHPDLSYAFDEMKEAPYLYNSAMMIMRREDFIDLCEFIFPMYDKLMETYGFKNDEDAYDYVCEHRDKYVKPNNLYYNEEMQSRLIAYLIERVTNVWLRIKRENGKSLMEQAANVEWVMPDESEIKV
jgi:hypothetical protein